ncbi:TetR/AcrR family transcriptional regulator [Aeromicrobium ginsengisoli]|uniref:TetR/AcrR family transcriptional regulator n=1 Tax=Aeromicrobium ginsengisoli TaxID=363867 RepID=A0A5M4FBM1_9ACTN|nr:TetR/AcrR family transcriptional regulator [Aeromicrobium ginsengisoli]KAA1395290.1 TetR/AcrR family transcriptional regulator [Aeromicrobium ginsengisoli]
MAPATRMKSEDRKVLILEAAIEEYGRSGMHATSTEVIAERAGVSQPYLFRLFGTKAGLIGAAIEHHTLKLRKTFREAAENRDPGTSPLEAMAMAYIGFMNDDVNSMRCQLHTWAAGSDPAIKDVAQRTYREIWQDIAALSGATADEVRDFMAQGMLLTVVAALDLTELYGDPLAVAKEF